MNTVLKAHSTNDTQPSTPKRFDYPMYQAALDYYGLPRDYTHVFRKKTVIDKTTGQPVKKPDGSEKSQLVSCSAAQTSKEGQAVWVQVNVSRPGTEKLTITYKDGKERQYPRRAKNDEIGTLQNISLDFEYPSDPKIALAIGKKLVDNLIAEGLAHETQPIENSGAGPHIVLPIPPIEIAEGEAERWNHAVTLLVNEMIRPEFDRLCAEAQIKMDLSGYDISRVLSVPGTWRPRNPAKDDCAQLQQGFLRSWLAPYVNGHYPVRNENRKLGETLREYYGQCAATSKSTHQIQPSERDAAREWLYRNAGQYYLEDRSAYFHALVTALYLKCGDQAVQELAKDIDRLSGEKYGDRAMEEVERSLEKAKELPRDNKSPSPVKKNDKAKKNDGTNDTGGASEEAKKPTTFELLAEIVELAKFIVTPERELFAHVPVNSHYETVPIREKGSGFRRWLTHYFDKKHHSIPNSEALTQIMERVKARATYEGEQASVYTRFAEKDGCVYLDMGNDKWQCIKISKDGWDVIDQVPVYFRRPNGMRPLPLPIRGGSLKDLRKIINVKTDEDFILIVGWLLGTLHPAGPYPVLGLNGERGSGKSLAEIYLRSIIDPNAAPARNAPKDDREAAIAAQNNMVIALDNLSSMPLWLSDILCRIATGNGFSTRQLYEDDVEKIFNAKRPIILNGIEDGIISQGDLLSRTIQVTLEPPEKYIAEEDIEQQFQELHPSLLGALLDAASMALRDRRTTRVANAPRMVDFAQWVTAAEPALKWKHGAFMKVFTENQKNATSIIIESSPVAEAIRQFIEKREQYKGLVSDLHKALTAEDEKYANAKQAPKNAAKLGGQLKRIASALRDQGINIHLERTREGSSVTIEKRNNIEKINSTSVGNTLSGVGKSSDGVGKNSVPTPDFEPEIETDDAEENQDGVGSVGIHAPSSAPLSSANLFEQSEECEKNIELDKACKLPTLPTLPTYVPQYEEVF